MFLGFEGDVVVDKHAAAVFTDDNFLVHLNLTLALGRDFAETAATGVAVDGDDSKTVAGLFADALVGSEVVLVDVFLLFGRFVEEAHLVLLGFFDNAFEFGFLGVEFGLAFLDEKFGGLDVLLKFFDFVVGVAVAAFAELDFKVLEFDFHVDGFKLAVVAHIVLLFLVLLDHGLMLGDVVVALGDVTILFGNVVLEIVDAGLETCNLVFEVLDGLGEFATDDFDFVNL